MTLLTNPSQENSWEPEWLHQTLRKWKPSLIRNTLNLALKPSFFMCFLLCPSLLKKLFWDSLHWELLFKFRFGTTASLGSWWCRDGLRGGSLKVPSPPPGDTQNPKKRVCAQGTGGFRGSLWRQLKMASGTGARREGPSDRLSVLHHWFDGRRRTGWAGGEEKADS